MQIRFLALILFLLALALRLWNLNTMGRTWDEPNIVEKGYDFVQLALHKDFSNGFWYKLPDHPPLSNYLYGLASSGDFVRFDKHGVISFAPTPYGAGIFQYDLTYSRLVSVFFSSLAVVLVFLIGVRYLSPFTGVVSAVVLAMLPHFLGYSQLVTHESLITCFFTASVFLYLLYFEKGTKLLLVAAGVVTGMTLELKQSNVLLFVLLFGLFLMWRRFHPKKQLIRLKHILLLSVIAVATCVLLWPMPVFHLPEFIHFTYTMWFKNSGKIPELIFGLHMGAPVFFYIIAFFVTTPVLILLLTILGIRVALEQRTWILLSLVWWFAVPFLLSIFHERQMMVRYIIEFYAPLSLLTAVGLEFLLSKLPHLQRVKYFALTLLAAYLFVILFHISPYYLDYYNELVGGTGTVYRHKLFFIGEWGQGLRNPGKFLADHAAKGSVIGVATNPWHTLYQSPHLHYELFNAQHTYDYVVTNTFNDFRLGFDEGIVQKKYTVVYTEKADGAILARVYKRK